MPATVCSRKSKPLWGSETLYEVTDQMIRDNILAVLNTGFTFSRSP